MASFLWKPTSERDGRLAVLLPSDFGGRNVSNVYIVGPQGNILESGKDFGPSNGNRPTYRFSGAGGAYPAGSRVVTQFADGGGASFGIGNPGGRNENVSPEFFEGSFDAASGGEGSNAFNPGGSGTLPDGSEFFTGPSTFGVAPPSYLTGFPTFQPVGFPQIQSAPFEQVDTFEFGKQFGEQARQDLGTNFAQAQEFGLQAVDTELQGLQKFAPAASALSREQTSLDNQFNQAERLKQVQGALPNAQGDLAAQRERSLAYAEGRLPDDRLDRALELGIRSRAADQATFGGFGGRSATAEKVSDLMSAEQRLQISQYGEELFGQNLSTSANLLMAPTQYANLGSQIKPTPELGASRVATSLFPLITQQTSLSAAQALQTEVNQNQFSTELEQQTRRFNSEGQFKASTFNSENQFTAQLGAFGYNASYLAAAQAANQAASNRDLQSQINAENNEIAGEILEGARDNQTVQAVTGLLGSIYSLVNDSTTAPDTGSGSDDTTKIGQGSLELEPLTSQPLETTDIAPTEPQDLNIPETPTASFEIPKTSAPQVRSLDASLPGSVKVADGSPVPTGFTAVTGNGDGTYSAVQTSGYQSDLERFAKFGNVNSSSLDLGAIARADRSVTDAAELSYVPVRSFPQVALTGSGRPVYSSPAAASSGNTGIGMERSTGLLESLGRLGVEDQGILNTIGEVGSTASNAIYLADLETKNGREVADSLLERFNISKSDLKSIEGQQFGFAAQRIGEIYKGLSPYQKSAAITALTNSAVELKTGKKIANQVIPGTEDSPVGSLKVGDAMQLNAEGQNGFAVARNWNQLSAITDMAFKGQNTKTKSVRQVANYADTMGMTGFGPQAAAVPVDAQQLKASGAEPAPAFGIGAMAFSDVASIPANYKVITTTPDGRALAVPENLTATSGLSNTGSLPLSFQKTTQIQGNQHPAQRAWGRSPLPSVRGAAGGSAMIAGLDNLKKSNTKLFGSIVAYSLFNSTMGA